MGSQHECYICNTSYEKISLLRNHMKNVHSGRSWKCEICQKSYKTKGDLKKHTIKHDPNWQGEGTDCDLCCKRVGGISSHKRKVHEKRTLSCDICTKKFTGKWNLKEHKITHDGTEYQCQMCTKTFLSNSKLSAHRKCHSNPEIKRKLNCQLCNKMLTPSALISHMRIHKGVRAKCNICNKMSSNQENLKKHIFRNHLRNSFEEGITQSKEKHSVTFECKVCGKIYNKKTSQDYHTLIHTGERPFKR